MQDKTEMVKFDQIDSKWYDRDLFSRGDCERRFDGFKVSKFPIDAYIID